MLPLIDRNKLRAHLRRLGDEYIFYVLDEAIEVMTPEPLALATRKYVPLEDVQAGPPEPVAPSLLDDVRSLDVRARGGEYYQAFDVNSRNCKELSGGTLAFIADYGRLMDRCVVASEAPDLADTAAAFDLLFGLLRHHDASCDDIVFFADEAGSWQIPVDWPAVFPAWFRCLAQVATPDEFADSVVNTVEDFEHYAWGQHIEEAERAATPAQRDALLDRTAKPRRRR